MNQKNFFFYFYLNLFLKNIKYNRKTYINHFFIFQFFYINQSKNIFEIFFSKKKEI
jgi:hypothetical protein